MTVSADLLPVFTVNSSFQPFFIAFSVNAVLPDNQPIKPWKKQKKERSLRALRIKVKIFEKRYMIRNASSIMCRKAERSVIRFSVL